MILRFCRGLWKVSLLGTLVLFNILVSTFARGADAQIVPDNTLGNESSVVTPNTNVRGLPATLIEGGATRGLNLFQSFSQFNVGDGERVYFANPTGIENILTRVSGNNLSNIFGTLGVDGNANLFLLNPNGIVFGQNARLDVTGSFVGTTGDSIEFEDGNLFSAKTNQTNNLLTISVPVGLQMGSQPGRIENLAVNGLSAGGSLALIGGEINLDGGRLFANDSLIQLAAVGVNTQVGINQTQNQNQNQNTVNNSSSLGFSFPENAAGSPITFINDAAINADGNSNIKLFGGEIGLDGGSSINGTNGATIDIDGTQFSLDNGSALTSLTQTTGKGGDIEVRAQNDVNIRNSFVSSESTASATGDGGDIRITGKNINVVGNGNDFGSTVVASLTQGQGNAGGITLSASDAINVADSAAILVTTSGTGNTADLTLQAKNEVNFTNNPGMIIFTTGPGSTGDLRIETGSLRLNNMFPNAIASFSSDSGASGSISIQADDTVEITDASLAAQALSQNAQAGDISIKTRKLLLQDGGDIGTDTTGSANGGNIWIQASESVNISGNSQLEPLLLSGIFSRTGLGATGNAGDITIETPRLTIIQGGQINTSSIAASGNAGNITILAKDVLLDGFVIIDPNRVDLSPDGLFSTSRISTSVVQGVTDDVKGGKLTIDTERLGLSNGANLESPVSGGRGKAGHLFVRATDSIDISGVGPRNRDGESSPAGLFADMQTRAIGVGGNIEVETGRLSLSSGGQISAGSFAQGDAGDISINTNQIDMRGEGTAIGNQIGEEAIGNAGRIDINTQGLNLEDGAFISSSTLGQGNAGDLIINADNISMVGETSFENAVGERAKGGGGNLQITTNRLSLLDGAYISSTTRGDGKAGSIFIDAKEQIKLDREALISVASRSDGTAGNININSPLLQLFNNSSIIAETDSQDGGNIGIENANLVLLRQGSQISTTAGEGGNGGNINIQSRAIVALPQENSDIRANAVRGRGGNVNITTDGLFGIFAANQPTDQSDITASSEVGIQGEVNVNQPDVDPTQEIIELPEGIGDRSDLIGQVCPRNTAESDVMGEFFITGRGGLPPSPDQPLSSDVVWEDTRSTATTRERTPKTIVKTPKPKANKITPATGWVFNEKGEVTLISSASKPTLEKFGSASSCPTH